MGCRESKWFAVRSGGTRIGIAFGRVPNALFQRRSRPAISVRESARTAERHAGSLATRVMTRVNKIAPAVWVLPLNPRARPLGSRSPRAVADGSCVRSARCSRPQRIARHERRRRHGGIASTRRPAPLRISATVLALGQGDAFATARESILSAGSISQGKGLRRNRTVGAICCWSDGQVLVRSVEGQRDGLITPPHMNRQGT